MRPVTERLHDYLLKYRHITTPQIADIFHVLRPAREIELLRKKYGKEYIITEKVLIKRKDTGVMRYMADYWINEDGKREGVDTAEGSS